MRVTNAPLMPRRDGVRGESHSRDATQEEIHWILKLYSKRILFKNQIWRQVWRQVQTARHSLHTRSDLLLFYPSNHSYRCILMEELFLSCMGRGRDGIYLCSLSAAINKLVLLLIAHVNKHSWKDTKKPKVVHYWKHNQLCDFLNTSMASSAFTVTYCRKTSVCTYAPHI